MIIFLWMGLQKSSIIFFPFKAPSFYWEAELCSLGDPEDQDPGPSISVGFAPSTDQLASGWINPVGSCLLHRFFLLCIVFLFFLFGFIVILCFFKAQYPWEFVQFVQVFLSTRWKPLIVTCSCMLQCQYEKMHLWLTFQVNLCYREKMMKTTEPVRSHFGEWIAYVGSKC